MDFYAHGCGRSRLAALAALPVLLALAACSSGAGGSSFSERFSQLIATGAPAPASVAGTAALDSCPPVQLRQGAGTYAVNNNARDPSALQLRYQVSVTQTARECASVAGTFTAKIGVHGRIVLGPAGGPGVVEVPLRYALVEEGMQPKTLWTAMHRVPVSIGEGQPHVTFTHIEESLTVPMPSAATLDRYVIYVGFDPLGAAQEKRPPQRKRAPRQS